MSIKAKIEFAALAGALALGAMTCTTASAAKTMKLAHGLPEVSTYQVGAAELKRLVEERTSGAVKIDVICCARLGSDEDMFRRLQQGTLDGAIIGLNLVGPFFPLVDTVHLPYMFRDRAHIEAVMTGPIADHIHDKLAEATGVTGLGYTDLLFRNIYNTKRPIESLEDVKGLKYRVPRNEVMIKTYEAFGANPTPLGWADTFSATQTGIVDGGDVAAIHLYQSKLYEIAKYEAFTEHFVLMSGFFLSQRFMAGLDDAQREVLKSSAREAAKVAREYGWKTESEAIEKMKAAGVVMTYPDKQPMIDAVQPIWAEHIKERGAETKELIEQILAVGK